MSDIYINSRNEFLLDRAQYFTDKRPLYMEIKDKIGENLSVSRSMIRVCGSAYWGRSFVTGDPFIAGTSDLDVAIISDHFFVQLLSEVRAKTLNFTNLTLFRDTESTLQFQDYAYRKGIIRLDICPNTPTRMRITTLFNSISKQYLKHFDSISASVYDTELSFTNKQAFALDKFGGKL